MLKRVITGFQHHPAQPVVICNASVDLLYRIWILQFLAAVKVEMPPEGGVPGKATLLDS